MARKPGKTRATRVRRRVRRDKPAKPQPRKTARKALAVARPLKPARRPRAASAASARSHDRVGSSGNGAAVRATLHTAALAMVGEGGPFENHPGPVLLASAADVIATNPAGQPIADLLRTGRAPALAGLIEQVGASGRARSEMLRLEVRADDGMRTAELTALPLADHAVLVIGRDATLDHNLRGALVDSRQRYKDLVEISSDFAWETGPQGHFVFVSPQGALGWRADELVGRDPQEFLADRDAGIWDNIKLPFQADRPTHGAELWFRRADGEAACLVATATPLYDTGGHWRGARGVCRDITAARSRDAALARAEARAHLLNYIVGAIRDDIVPQRMLDGAAAATARALSAAGCTICRARDRNRVAAGFDVAATFGRVPQEAVAAGLSLRAAGTGRVSSNEPVDFAVPGGGTGLAAPTAYRRAVNGAICLWRSAGDTAWNEDERDLLADVAAQLGLAIEQIANTEELERLSSTDGLTGLLNRRTFFTRLERRCTQLMPDGHAATLMYVDLDNFKLVNDAFGHQRGDEALLAVTGVLKSAAGHDDLVARLGGDEFALWLENCSADAAPQRAQALLEAGRVLGGFSGDPARPMGLSIGLAVFEPSAGEALEALIARADAAMYRVKRTGKGSFTLAPPAHAAG